MFDVFKIPYNRVMLERCDYSFVAIFGAFYYPLQFSPT